MSTINKEEIQKFSKLADEWWDVNGKFKPLHMFNPIRIEYIIEKIKLHFNISKEMKNNRYLENLKILDIGCGGGLISEPLSRLGGKVTGIDASEKYKEPCPEALVESAKHNIKILEDNDFFNFKISVKSSDIFLTVKAYQMLSKICNYPLHLGVTEAGGLFTGSIKSSIGIDQLLTF